MSYKYANLAKLCTSFIEDLNWQLGLLFWTVFTISEGIVSIQRIQDVLNLDERILSVDENTTEIVDEKAACLSNVNAYWPKSTEKNNQHSKSKNEVVPTDTSSDNNSAYFSNLSADIISGELLGIIGPVGSGKSSFLSIFLNELTLTGNYRWNQNIAYCPQESWIFVGTIRENILVGRAFNAEKYEDVTRVCCLLPDFETFADRDQTVVGERGVTLSGGQRARINLARAIYGDAEIYLLDDPLAAVDTKVAQMIFCDVILGYLKSKTRILVTHHVDLLQNADRIICFENSEIIFTGQYSGLGKISNSFLQTFLEKKRHNRNEKSDLTSIVPHKLNPILQTESGNQMEDESRQTGNIGLKYFGNYFLMCGSKILVMLWILLLLLTQTLQILTDLQLAMLGSAGDNTAMLCNNTVTNNTECTTPIIKSSAVMKEFYIYLGLFFIWLFSSITTGLQYINVVSKSSQNIHDVTIASLVKTSMDFFHANPTGRIMNRFTKDMGVIDDLLILDADELICTIMLIFGILLINVITMWFSFVAVIPLICIILFVRQYYVRTAREVKRLEGVQQSPVFSHFTETINGRISINAFHIEKYMTEKAYEAVDYHGSAWITFVQLNRWLQLRLDVITALFFTALR